MPEEPRPTREQKKERAYLERLHRDAQSFRSSATLSDAQIEEIRRWEGSAAAAEAERARSGGAAAAYTRVSRAAPATAGRSRAVAPTGAVMPTNGFAIVSFVLGIVGGSMLAVVFGHLALRQIELTGEQGRGLATAGLVLGYLSLAVGVVSLIVLFGIGISARG